MSFYIFDFGPLSAKVQEYADMDGFIPSVGDKWSDFHWPHAKVKAFADKETGERVWQDFLKGAIAATSKACGDLEALEWSDY